MAEYAPLPDEVLAICRSVGASQRLVAHLTLVHDVAGKIMDALHHSFPELAFDAELVRFGAATHDIGKAIHIEELSGPGSRHERSGFAMLKELRVSDVRARFTFTHAEWNGGQMEDLLVALADNCWRGKRLGPLEEEVVRIITIRTGKEGWEVFAALDDILQKVVRDADLRLAWQAQFPIAQGM